MTEETLAIGQLRQRVLIIRAAAKLGREGELQKGMDRQEAAALIAAQALADNGQTFASAEFDWQTFIELILQLLPLILAIFGI